MEPTTKPLNITCHVHSSDGTLFRRVIDQGIDAHLEAFTKSKFKVVDHMGFPKIRLVMDFDRSEVPTLVRRLEEIDTEDALRWIDDLKEHASEYF